MVNVNGTDHFTMNTHLSLLVTLTCLRIITVGQRNIKLKYSNTVTVKNDRKEGKSGLLLANIAKCCLSPVLGAIQKSIAESNADIL